MIYKVGIIGLGEISSVYINHLKQYGGILELYGCACRSLDKAQRIADEYGIQKAYASGEELIADPTIDVILNLTTPDAHYALNKAALESGKHVYSEKPLAVTFKEAAELVAIASGRGLSLGCAPDTFMGGRQQTWRRLLDEGALGTLFGGTAAMVCHGFEWEHPNPEFLYQPGAGPLMDMGPYYVTALCALMGPVEEVSAMASQGSQTREILAGPRKGEAFTVHPELMTHLIANLRFRSGALVSMIMSFDVWDSGLPRMELYGTKATLCMKEEDPDMGPAVFGGDVLMRNKENYRWRSLAREEAGSDWIHVPVTHGHTSVSEFENSRGIGLVDQLLALREGRAARASGAMALHTLEVLEGVLSSARSNAPVRMHTSFERPDPVPEVFP